MMSWINTLRTSAEDLGTLAENEPPTLSTAMALLRALRPGLGCSSRPNGADRCGHHILVRNV